MTKNKLNTKPRSMIVAVYAPHAHLPDEDKELLYEKLNTEMNTGGGKRKICCKLWQGISTPE